MGPETPPINRESEMASQATNTESNIPTTPAAWSTTSSPAPSSHGSVSSLPTSPASSIASFSLGGMEVKKLYLVCICADPNCTNLVWSSSPTEEKLWPPYSRDSDSESNSDSGSDDTSNFSYDDDPELSPYGLLHRFCSGSIGPGEDTEWRTHDLVARSVAFKNVIEMVLEGHPKFELDKYAGEEEWVFKASSGDLGMFFDRWEEFDSYAAAELEDSPAAETIVSVLESMTE